MEDLIRREDALAILDLAEHDAEERDWRSGANEIARLIQRVRSIPASPEVAEAEARGMERAAMTVAQGWCVPPNTRKTFDPDLATGIQNVIRAEAAAIRRAAEGEKA